MRLSRESRYAIEALLVLADHPPGHVVGAKQIAVEASLPPAFLHKILRQLAVAGIVTSRRGAGYALSSGPHAITVARVLGAIEREGSLDTGCIFWREDCSNDNPCELHFRWRELRPEILGILAATTIADVREANMPILADPPPR
jgi:Rrf2 family iron-sulfur cluster assembly transcriptional regulator